MSIGYYIGRFSFASFGVSHIIIIIIVCHHNKISQLVIHTLRDVISFPLVGDIQDWTHNWKTTCVLLTCILFLATIFWSMGIFISGDTRRTESTTST
ncbi:hypothetical protein G4B88_010451, partial [Cannabis sativa]